MIHRKRVKSRTRILSFLPGWWELLDHGLLSRLVQMGIPKNQQSEGLTTAIESRFKARIKVLP